ncbi:MAG: rhodanese-like domain-containing protein [Acidobacteria bacterium]|nr:rhodanese-like domain-containing protein [Acidobacteriota bacterium]
MSECTVLTLNEKLGSEEIHLVDVREHVENAAGRIEGAKLMPLGEIEKRHSELDHHKPIYVFCRSGNRSAQAQKKLHDLGFDNVVNVKGGFNAWKNEGLPYEQNETAPWDLERQVRFVAGMLILTGFVLSLLVHRYLIGISVFIGAGLTFSALTNTCTMGMILAKMPWNKIQPACEAGTNPAK